jgi:prolyl oligopeptidase
MCAAPLLGAHAGSTPVLIRIETRAGHGAGKPISKIIDEVTDRWGFLLRELRMTLPQSYQSESSATPAK